MCIRTWASLTLLVLAGNVSAQDSTLYLRPNLFMVGGSATAYNKVDRLQSSPGGAAPASSLGFEIAPSFAYLFSPTYSLGAEGQFTYNLQENNFISGVSGQPARVRQEAYSLSLVPEARLYLGVVERLYGFASVGLGYSLGMRSATSVNPTTNLVINNLDYSSYGWRGQGGAGLLYFVRPTVAFTLQGNYRVALEHLVLDGTPPNPDDLLPETGLYIRQGLSVRLGFGLYFKIRRPDRPVRSAETKATRKKEEEKKEK